MKNKNIIKMTVSSALAIFCVGSTPIYATNVTESNPDIVDDEPMIVYNGLLIHSICGGTTAYELHATVKIPARIKKTRYFYIANKVSDPFANAVVAIFSGEVYGVEYYDVNGIGYIPYQEGYSNSYTSWNYHANYCLHTESYG